MTANIKLLGETTKVEKGYIVKGKSARVGHEYYIICPKCGENIVFKPEKEGGMVVRCTKCAQKVAVKTKLPVVKQDVKTDTVDESEKAKEHKGTVRISDSGFKNGELHWKARMLGCPLIPKSYRLRTDRINTIGRQDSSCPSDVSLQDDYVSRQSVTIEVVRQEVGFQFKMKVVNASNPVFLNGSRQSIGETVYLQDNDTIRMGRSVLTFKLSK